jgi:predicted nucleotidyltransferase
MYNDFTKHILRVCKSLNEFRVHFVIVGGTASGFHGFYRLTVDYNGLPTEKHDFDFWFDPTYENYFNILKAMKSLGKDTSRLESESAPNPKKSFLKFDFEEFKIDFLPEIKGLESFSNSYSRASTSIVGSVEFKILSLEDLIKAKESDSRPKDISDLEELRKLRDKNIE